MRKAVSSELGASDSLLDAIHKKAHENNMQLINIVEAPRLIPQVIIVPSPFDSFCLQRDLKLLSTAEVITCVVLSSRLRACLNNRWQSHFWSFVERFLMFSLLAATYL